jgi:Fur family peroxide stress response transcriptional regulator
MKIEDIKNKILSKGLKATVQRIYVYKALLESREHPTAEDVFKAVSSSLPTISLSTIYNTLETLYEHSLINKVQTENGIVRYDAYTETHHHIYTENGEIIGDYYDPELDKILNDYFSQKKINDLEIKEIKLQIKCSTKNQRS